MMGPDKSTEESARACQLRCQNQEGCTQFAWWWEKKNCWLLDTKKDSTAWHVIINKGKADVISGPKVCEAPPPQEPPKEPPQEPPTEPPQEPPQKPTPTSPRRRSFVWTPPTPAWQPPTPAPMSAPTPAPTSAPTPAPTPAPMQ